MPKIDLDICQGCGLCINACPNNAITMENKKATIDKDLCLGCDVCIGSCPQDAITSDRFRRVYPYHWLRPHPPYPLYYQPHFHQAYYPIPRRRRRGW